ncbi:MAG: glycosyltransferase family 4 protein, partial [Candidatus Omnitrophota bacterium]
MNKCLFIVNSINSGDSGMSGGDRIYLELARRWKDRLQISILASAEAETMCRRQGLADIGIDIRLISREMKIKESLSKTALLVKTLKKTVEGISFVIKNKELFKSADSMYSASDFYSDSIPAFLVKKFINPKIKWIAGFYLFAPAPWTKDNPYRENDLLRGILYCLTQRPVYWLVKRCADHIFVTSQPDVAKFLTKKRGSSGVTVVLGGVDITEATECIENGGIIPAKERKYDACFIGRFHQQKGVLVLIDIWKKVAAQKPGALLAMIGNGPLEKEVSEKIAGLGLKENIQLMGFLEGKAANEVFKQSRVVLHPATFDSGGMASAGAMAWGLPGVSFDLESLRTYYPKGMVKAPLFDLDAFAGEVLRLLNDPEYYEGHAARAR